MTDTSLDLLKRRQQDEPEQAQDTSLDILKQRQQQRAQIQKSTMLSATSTNPDQYASELKLADEIKAPVNVVSLAPDEAQRVATENRIRKAEAENPKVTGWAGKGDNAKLAHDDLEGLIDFDNAFVRYLANTGISLRDGLAGIFAPMRDFGTGIVTGAPDIAGKAVESVGTFRDAANQYFSNLSPFALQKQAKQDDFAEGFKDTGQGVQGVAQYLREATGQDRESVPSIAGDTISQVAGFAVAPTAMSSAYFLSSSQQGYEEALQEGANQDQSLAKGFLDGLIELGSEKMGTEKILKYIPAPAKDGLIKQALDMLKGSGIEIFEEYAAEVGKQLTSKGIYDPDKEIDFTPLSAEEVTGMGLGISILIGGSRRMQMAAEREQQQAIIDKQKELLTELRDKAEASKTFSRNKKTFQDFVDSINPDEDPNVYIDAQGATEYLQDDAELVFEQLGAGQQYRDAMVAGGDVQVPFSAFVSLEERPYFESLLDDLRYDIGGNTARELRDNQDDTDILQEAQRIVEEGKAQQETLSIGDEVYQNIKDQLGSTGRFNTDIADQYAKLHQAFATTFIERGLATPEQMKRYYNLGIVDQMKQDAKGVTFQQQEQAERQSAEAKGLPMDQESRLQRARDMGFDTGTVWYHGTAKEGYVDSTDISEFDPEKTGDRWSAEESGFFFTSDNQEAGYYARSDADYRTPGESNGAVYPVFLRMKNPLVIDKQFLANEGMADIPTQDGNIGFWDNYQGLIREWVENAGADSVIIKESDTGRQMAVAFNPPDIRSINAAFDPEYSDSANLLYQNEWQKRMQPDSDMDDVITYIRKLGGINVNKESDVRGRLKHLDAENRMVGLPSIEQTNGSGLTIDYVGEVLIEGGYLLPDENIGNGVDKDAVLDLLFEAESGPVYSIQAQDRIEREKYEEEFAEELKATKDEADKMRLSGLRDQLPPSIPLKQRKPLGPKTLAAMKKAPRGSITFPTEGIGNNTTYIKLMEGANLSTFLHESGHFFLEVLRDISAQPDAAPEAVEMMAALTEWFGTDQISREQHEQFARGFEAYLREGKAPSSELQSVFERFMGWLLLVYKKLSQLNVKITPEVRNVMDRMLATDEAITAVEDAAGFQPIFSAASEGGMTDGEYNNYLKGVEKARNDALTDLRAKHISELERGRKDAWRDEKSQIRKDVEQQVARDPVFQVKNALMYGKLPDGTDLPPEYENIKLDRDWLIERYGDKGIWRKLPFGKNSVTSSNGINPETVAEIFGFTSADEMITRMVEAGSMEAEIRQRVNDEMIARHGDMMKEDDSLAREAMGSVSKDSRATQIYTELRMLSRQAGGRPAPIDIIKQAARQQIQAMKAREIQPYRFLRAMQKHSREALKALADGDFQSSLAHKTQQLLNFQLYTEAMKAKDQVDKIQRYLAKFDSANVRKKLDRDYLDQIDSILESVSLKKSVSNKEIDRRKSFSAWYDSMIDSGQPVELPRDYVERLKTHYRDMSISNLQALKDAVTNIEHLAKLKYKIKMGQEQRDFDDTMDRAHEFALENNKQTYDPESWEKKNLQKVRDIADDLLASHVKVEALLEQLDGDIEGGDWWTMIFRPLADAENMELEMTAQAGQAIAPIMSRDTFKNLNQKIFINTRMGSMTREQILSMALNWGNAANRDALVRGFNGKMDYNETRRVLNENLSAEDWQTIQDIWDYINTYWDQIAALQKRLTGVVPEKVEPDQFDTPHGTFKGGYYPLVYDGSKSYRVFKREERQSTEELLSTNFLRPATKKGHTQERVGSGGLPVHLDLSVISQHVSNVIHDLTHREAILQADKVIQDSRTRDAVERIAGRSMYRQLRPWLANIAGGNRQPSTWLESIVGALRRNTTIVNMGLKFTTAAVQFTGYTQSVELLGEHWAARGLKDFYGHPLKAKAKFKEVMGKSVYMQNRATRFDRDVHDQISKLKGEGMLKVAQKYYFTHIGYMDLMVSVPTWLGAYEKALAEGKSETDSIALADRAVRLSQGSGSAKDLAAIQRGSEYQRMFTLFYTYFSSMYNLMRRRVKISGRDGMSPSVFGRGLMSYSYLVIIPAVLSEVITGRFPDDDEDDDENLMQGLKMVSSYPLQSMVGVRDMVSALTTDFGYSMTPVAQAAESIIQPAGDASDWLDGEFNETDAKHLIMSAGYLFGLPSRQIWISASNLYDMSQGEDLSPSETLMLQEHRD